MRHRIDCPALLRNLQEIVQRVVISVVRENDWPLVKAAISRDKAGAGQSVQSCSGQSGIETRHTRDDGWISRDAREAAVRNKATATYSQNTIAIRVCYVADNLFGESPIRRQYRVAFEETN